MGGLKSGSGDDLWGDDGDEETDDDPADAEHAREEKSADDSADGQADRQSEPDDSGPMTGGSDGGSGGETQQPYIVRRAVQDKSVQFERDERLTFFVHDDVVNGERELLSDAEAALGRSVPKFDLREAVYRAAIRNKEDVLAELVKMGYKLDDQ
jgi:hypothetical protein